MSDTPRTDAIDGPRLAQGTPQYHAMLDLARTLGRELAEARMLLAARGEDAECFQADYKLAVQYAEGLHRALYELVRLKSIKDWLDVNEPAKLAPTRDYFAEGRREEYDRCKEPAWAAARAALAKAPQERARDSANGTGSTTCATEKALGSSKEILNTSFVSEIRLRDDGTLDEVCAPGAHMEHLDKGHWFVEIGDVAVWLHSKSRITTSYERREREATPVGGALGAPKRERWCIVRESVLDVGLGGDVRTGGKPQLGYALLADAATFESEEAAHAALKEADLPLGWVPMPLSRLLPDIEPVQGEGLTLRAAATKMRDEYRKEFRSAEAAEKNWDGWVDGFDPAEGVDAAYLALDAALKAEPVQEGDARVRALQFIFAQVHNLPRSGTADKIAAECEAALDDAPTLITWEQYRATHPLYTTAELSVAQAAWNAARHQVGGGEPREEGA